MPRLDSNDPAHRQLMSCRTQMLGRCTRRDHDPGPPRLAPVPGAPRTGRSRGMARPVHSCQSLTVPGTTMERWQACVMAPPRRQCTRSDGSNGASPRTTPTACGPASRERCGQHGQRRRSSAATNELLMLLVRAAARRAVGAGASGALPPLVPQVSRAWSMRAASVSEPATRLAALTAGAGSSMGDPEVRTGSSAAMRCVSDSPRARPGRTSRGRAARRTSQPAAESSGSGRRLARPARYRNRR